MILTEEWLENLEQKPSSTAYRLLAPHYKPVYTNERFVFYCGKPVDQNVLDNLLLILDFIDISRYFCNVITTQSEVADYMQTQGCSVDLVDNVPDAPNVEHPVQPLFWNKNLCVHAWAGIHLNPAGTASICCEHDDIIPAVNIQDNSIDEILQTKYMQEIRNTFRQGKTPSACHVCKKREDLETDSKRSLSPYKLGNIWGYVDWESNNLNGVPKFLGGHIGNLCNLKCRICSPRYSSQVAAEEYKNNLQPIVISHNWSKDHCDFWEEIRDDQSLVNFEFLGGEPLLLEENLKYMQFLIETGRAEHSIFEFISNGTQFPMVFEHLGNFKRFTITLSIDNITDRFEYERKGASWQQLTENIKKFVDVQVQNPSVEVNVCITVSALNVLYLDELTTWLDAQGIKNYYLNILRNPRPLSIESLNKPTIDAVCCKLKNNPHCGQIISRLEKTTPTNGVEFCEYIRVKDRIRNENLANSHYELAQLMGYML